MSFRVSSLCNIVASGNVTKVGLSMHGHIGSEPEFSDTQAHIPATLCFLLCYFILYEMEKNKQNGINQTKKVVFHHQ